MISAIVIGASIIIAAAIMARELREKDFSVAPKPKKKKVKGAVVMPEDKRDIDELINELNGK